MRIALLFLFVLLCSAASAQPIEQVDQRTESVTYGPVIAIGGDRWAVVGQANVEGGIPVPGQFIRAFHADGSTAWERPVDHISWDGRSLVAMPDSGLLAGGYTYWCDVFSDLSSLARYTPDGDTLWSIHIPSTMPSFTKLSHGITSLIAVASVDSVHVLGMDGTALHAWSVPMTPARVLHWSGDSLLFLLAGNGLYAMDAEGNMISNAILSAPGTDLRIRDSVVLVLRADTLLRFTMGLEELGGAALADTALHFVDGEDATYLRTTSGLYEAAIVDEPLQMMTIAALPGLVPSGGSLRDGTLMTTGNTLIAGRSSAVLRSHMDNGASANHDDDIEVLLQVDSTWYQFSSQQGPYTIYNQLANLTALVVNHGSSTLQSAVLSFRFPNAIGYCGTPAHTIIDTVMALSPGDTAMVQFSGMYLNHGPSEPGDFANYTVCVTGLAPNNKVDRQPMDNTGCATAYVVNTVGIDDNLLNASWSVFPNPFEDRITINSAPGQKGSIYLLLCDLQGRTVFDQWILPTADGSLELLLPGLADGAYVLRAIGTDRIWSQTLIKTGH